MKYANKGSAARVQTFWEEMANGITHGIGALASLFALIFLLFMAFKSGEISVIIAFGIYGVSILLLYTFSSLYHFVTNKRIKHIFRVCDHISIYLLIAGSYTPITILALGDFWGKLMFLVVWSMAGLGIIYEIFFLGRNKLFSVILYLIMGWVAVVAAKPLWEFLDFSILFWLIVGGLTYSLGVIFYLLKRMPFSHALWHCFVLLGSVAHFICFYKVGFSS